MFEQKLRAILESPAMKVELGQKALSNSWQEEFQETSKCKCGGEARIAFVAHEMGSEDKTEFVYSMHKNDPNDEGLWPHDAIAIAVYLCKECLEPTAIFNQA